MALADSIAVELEQCQDLIFDLRALQSACQRRATTAAKVSGGAWQQLTSLVLPHQHMVSTFLAQAQQPGDSTQLQQYVRTLTKQLQQEQQAHEDLLAQHEVLRDMLRSALWCTPSQFGPHAVAIALSKNLLCAHYPTPAGRHTGRWWTSC